MFLSGGSSGQYWSFSSFDHLDVLTLFPLNEFSVFGLALAAVGLVYAWRRARLFAVYGLFLCALVAIRGADLPHPQRLQLPLPAYLFLAIWAGCGAQGGPVLRSPVADVRRLRWAHSGQYLFSPLAAALLLLLPALACRPQPAACRQERRLRRP